MNKTKSYILEATDIQIIEEQSRRMGNSSDSAALRVIIREWAKMKESRAEITIEASIPEAA